MMLKLVRYSVYSLPFLVTYTIAHTYTTNTRTRAVFEALGFEFGCIE